MPSPEKRIGRLPAPDPEEKTPKPAVMITRRPVLVKESFERRLGCDLLNILEAEVPDADAAVIGLTIASEARRREEQNARAWGDRERTS